MYVCMRVVQKALSLTKKWEPEVNSYVASTNYHFWENEKTKKLIQISDLISVQDKCKIRMRLRIFWMTPVCTNVLTNSFTWPAWDTRSTYKRSLTGLNSDFSSTWTACITKAKEPTHSSIHVTHHWRENNWIYTFPKSNSSAWNAISFV